MIDKPSASETLGLELEGSHLKAVRLKLIKGKPKLDSLFEINLDPETTCSLDFHESADLPSSETSIVSKLTASFTKANEIISSFSKEITNFFQKESNVKPLDIENISDDLKLKSLRELLSETLNSTCLKGYQTIIRPLEIKLKKKKDILAALPFQVEPILPFSSDLAIVDKIDLEETTEGTLLTIVAAKKEHIKQHLEELKINKIEPEVISSEPSALVCFSTYFFSSKAPYFIIYFGINHVNCILVRESKLIASQSYLFEDLEEKNKEGLNKLTLILYSLSKQMKGVEVHNILFLGNVKEHQQLAVSLSQKLKKNVVSIKNDTSFQLSEEELEKFAVPLGLALNLLPKQSELINFRKNEFVYPNPWKHIIKSLVAYGLVSIGITLSFYLFGQAYLNHREDEIKTDYVNLLTEMNRPYRVFEYEYLAKFPAESENEGDEITPVKALTQDDIHNRLNFLYKELQAAPDLFPLFPNVPRVSDVLAWLSNHPNVIKIDPLTNEVTSLITLESFNYSVLKRPELTKKQEKYQVKVEFEFSTATPKLAREFHDALIAPNEITDPKGEVKWSSNRGKYKTSFFLKDKTVYPSTRL